VKKIVLALLATPTVANAQVPVYQQAPDAPRTLDPGSSEPAKPPPAPASKPATPQQPNVIVVGPDGKVTYDPSKQQQQPTGYYYSGDENVFGDNGDSYDEGPVTVHNGPTPDLHVVRKGDTLWDICFYYFNDPWQWPKVWSYNPTITNPHWIYPGDLVRLLPKGFTEQPLEPETGAQQPANDTAAAPVDHLPAPAQRTDAAVRQTAFVEKSDLDKSITVDGSVDEKELLAVGDSVYLRYPENNPPKVGKRYSVYKPNNSVKSDGKDIGSYVHILGELEVVSVLKDRRARAVITAVNQEIERGAKVGPLLKEFKTVPLVPAKVDAQGTIVAMLTKDQLIGRGEVVFIDLGRSAGIEVGNRMAVVRRGDALPDQGELNVGQDDRRYPTRKLGEVRIVDVGDKVSIGLVTLSVQEMGLGDLVMMQKQQ
jgi:hypothetical protein